MSRSRPYQVAVYPDGREVVLRPFSTLEALVENVQTAVYLCRAGDVENGVRRLEDVVVDKASLSLWEQLAILLPRQHWIEEGEFPISEGVIPEIVERIAE